MIFESFRLGICSELNPDSDCHQQRLKKVFPHLFVSIILYSLIAFLYLFFYNNTLNLFLGLDSKLGKKACPQSRKPSRQLRDLELILCL